MKEYLSSLLLIVCLAQGLAQNNDINFAVQVGAFEKRVNMEYFKQLEGVYEAESPYDIWYYYLPASSKEEADRLFKDATSKGYANARVVDFEDIRRNCSAMCSYVPNPPKMNAAKSVGPIFFDFDKSDLRLASREMLERLFSILYHNPSYTAELRANTDAKGTNDYNVALSQRRARSALNYVAGLGISPGRLSTKTLGEEAPLAKNQLDDGEDTEQGRQLNRRVDLIILDGNGKVLNEIIEEVKVPDPLKVTDTDTPTDEIKTIKVRGGEEAKPGWDAK